VATTIDPAAMMTLFRAAVSISAVSSARKLAVDHADPVRPTSFSKLRSTTSTRGAAMIATTASVKIARTACSSLNRPNARERPGRGAGAVGSAGRRTSVSPDAMTESIRHIEKNCQAISSLKFSELHESPLQNRSSAG
jgi:hypothetical protein